MKQVRNEIYDENGLVTVEFIEVEEELTIEEQIAQKQEQLLQIYAEIQNLQQSQNT
jgi:hypothetical protein